MTRHLRKTQIRKYNGVDEPFLFNQSQYDDAITVCVIKPGMDRRHKREREMHRRRRVGNAKALKVIIIKKMGDTFIVRLSAFLDSDTSIISSLPLYILHLLDLFHTASACVSSAYVFLLFTLTGSNAACVSSTV